MPANHEFTLENSNAILVEALSLLEARRNAEPANTRLEHLLANHFSRNDFRSLCCFGHKGGVVSVELFNSLCILPSTDWAIHLVGGSASIQPAFTAMSVAVLEQIKLLTENVIILFGDILESHPQSDLIRSNFPRGGLVPSLWVLAILGLKKHDGKSDYKPPTLDELRRRIALSLDASIVKKLDKPASQFFSQDNGFLWQKVDDSFDINKVYLSVCSEFPDRLEKLLQASGKTLDQLAGVEVAHRYPKVEALVREALSRGKKHGTESKDLKLEDGSLGGTVFAIHNAHHSVEWIAAYLVDTDNNVFMEDVRAASLAEKERLLRIFSTYHSQDHPSWVQFGNSKDVFVYLSRLASAAEQGFLKIQSYVINLLIDDINKAVKSLDTHGICSLDHFHYDTGVVSLGNPITSSLAAHQDAKPGIVCPHTPTFSLFLLMVPTMAFQNNCGPTAHLSWYRANDPKKTKQVTFVHDFFINHFQLMQVNDKFFHEACCLVPSFLASAS